MPEVVREILCKGLKNKKRSLWLNAVCIKQFRYCSLNNAFDYSVPELLKTVEMSEITVMISLFKCENARSGIICLWR